MQRPTSPLRRRANKAKKGSSFMNYYTSNYIRLKELCKKNTGSVMNTVISRYAADEWNQLSVTERNNYSMHDVCFFSVRSGSEPEPKTDNLEGACKEEVVEAILDSVEHAEDMAVARETPEALEKETKDSLATHEATEKQAEGVTVERPLSKSKSKTSVREATASVQKKSSQSKPNDTEVTFLS